jgi:hypothetical protein
MVSDQIKNPRKLLILNIILSSIIFILMMIFRLKIHNAYAYFFISINKPLSHHESTILDVIILSFLPLWTYFLYFKRSTSIQHIVITHLLAAVCILSVHFIALLLVYIFIKSGSPLIPNYFILIPFRFFFTFTMVVGFIVTILMHKLIFKSKLDLNNSSRLEK